MRIVLKSFLSGGPHEGSPGDIRDVEPDQAEHLIAVGAAIVAPDPEPTEPAPASPVGQSPVNPAISPADAGTVDPVEAAPDAAPAADVEAPPKQGKSR